jgi:hypothetical protein
MFSKFEFLVKQIIFSKLNPNIESINFYDYKFISSRNDILDNIPFGSCVHIIQKDRFKENKKLEKIYKLMNVRNEIAHMVDIGYISY